ncbi:hypothetical protein [Streptomyces sp. NPDC001401]|uniref:hypothetical protein n=1 Tax=Streptomyces sp. NPDC001401 TaxID=3364570 RepID=UPI0036CBAF22
MAGQGFDVWAAAARTSGTWGGGAAWWPTSSRPGWTEQPVGFAPADRVHGPPPAFFTTAGAQTLPVGGAAGDVGVSGPALNFRPEPGSGVAEAARVVAPGGPVTAYVWDCVEGIGFLQHFWDAVTTLDPSSAAESDEGRGIPPLRPASLRRLGSEAALVEVEDVSIEVPTCFADLALGSSGRLDRAPGARLGRAGP